MLLLLSGVFGQTPATETKKQSAEPSCVPNEEGAPPRLRRGRPGDRPEKPPCETIAVPIGAPTPVSPVEPGERSTAAAPRAEDAPVRVPDRPLTLIEKAQINALEYTSKLPNFLCEQLIRRYQSPTRRADWAMQDFVTVDVAYFEGREEYRNAKRNTKKVEWKSLKESGTFSEGEYGTTLQDVMHPATNANFRRRGMDSLGGTETEVYDFVVEKANSHWLLAFGDQQTKPKYRGAIWIDKKDNMVRRVEMEAMELPGSFPVSMAETILEYGPARIDNKTYILPVKSENLACFRSNPGCARNELEFRNYRKFTAQSTISTTESTVSFDSDAKPPAKKQ